MNWRMTKSAKCKSIIDLVFWTDCGSKKIFKCQILPFLESFTKTNRSHMNKIEQSHTSYFFLKLQIALHRHGLFSVSFHISLTWGRFDPNMTPIFLTFSNPIQDLNFYINADPVSNIQQNSVELCANLRFCHQAPIL